jgi:flagellar motor switch protein FliN/FliY
MIVDKAQIEALKRQAQREPNGAQSPPSAAASDASAAGPSAPLIRPGRPAGKIQRILHLHLPVIVRLAQRRMTIGTIRRLSLGSIIEFTCNVDRPLDLMINNQLIGRGEAVRVGDRFGLRIFEIRDRADRIQAMGERRSNA